MRSSDDGEVLVAALRRGTAGACFLVGLAAVPGSAQPAPADTAFSCPAEGVRMSTLMERTIFQVDVLDLEVCLGSGTAARLESLAGGRAYSEALADTVASVALGARDVRARIEFLRDVGLDRFLDGIRENLGKARDAGILTGEEYRSISSSLPRWYAFLEDRGIEEGDVMLYRIRGDTLRTAYRGTGGSWLLDQTDVGPHRRLSVLGGYFAPGSDFREGLIRSLLSGEDGG